MRISWMFRYFGPPAPFGGMLDPWPTPGFADERVRGLLIKRRRPLEAVALLEPQKRPLCLRAYYAVERTL
jgi:hypothetical protein